MNLVHEHSTHIPRQDLHARMAPRRRLPHPTSATSTSTSSTLRSGGDQPPPGVLTYSQFLGALDQTPSGLMSVFHPAGLSYPASSSGAPEPGPSHMRGSSRSAPAEASRVEIVVLDMYDDAPWGAHGKIEEVDDEEMMEVDEEAEGDALDSLETPRTRARGHGVEMNGVHDHEEENVPFISTPPPGVRPRKVPSLRETLSDRNLNSVHSAAASGEMDDVDTPGALPPAHPGVNSLEVALVKSNIDLIYAGQEHAKFMSTFFFALGSEQDLSEHIDLCSKLEEHLESLRQTLTLRTKISSEEWGVRSTTWDQHYSKRLLSLRTTLERLGRLRQLIERQPFRPRQRQTILTKLEQHEAKLGDLASKYNTAFDRLRLRHLHFLLTQSHNEAKRQKKAQKARLMSRASFERRWREGKAYRAGLRNDYHELRQEFYDTHYPGLNPAP